MGDVDVPLLRQQGAEQDRADGPEDLERGLSQGAGHDFRHLIDSQPEAVIK